VRAVPLGGVCFRVRVGGPRSPRRPFRQHPSPMSALPCQHLFHLVYPCLTEREKCKDHRALRGDSAPSIRYTEEVRANFFRHRWPDQDARTQLIRFAHRLKLKTRKPAQRRGRDDRQAQANSGGRHRDRHQHRGQAVQRQGHTKASPRQDHPRQRSTAKASPPSRKPSASPSSMEQDGAKLTAKHTTLRT